MKPHQVFVLFQNVETGQEVIFVAEADAESNFKFDVDLGTAGKDSFGGNLHKLATRHFHKETFPGDSISAQV